MHRATASCTLALPREYRHADLLDFHRRDDEGVAERVGDRSLDKGLAWRGHPACIAIRLGPRSAELRLDVDGKPDADLHVELETTARRMMGLTQDVRAFERRFRGHPQMGPLIAARPGLRIPLAATPFEAIAWAIVGQQISVRAAVGVRRRLVRAAGLRHSGGLYCFPDAPRVADLGEEALRAAGLSYAKARALRLLARQAATGGWPPDSRIDATDAEEIGAALMHIPGIGQWTASYALLRGFGWLDGSLHGDAAVRRGLQKLRGSPEPVTPDDAKRWLEEFAPWRALVAAHLWAMVS